MEVIMNMWCDDITFCQEKCERMDCPRNQHNIRDRSVPHSFSVEIPQDCLKKQKGMKSKIPDREKIINDLTDIGVWIAGRVGFDRARNFLHTIDDAVALLKEQEAVEPRRDANYVRMFRCGACGKYVGFIDSYCSNCGRKVKWNDRQRES